MKISLNKTIALLLVLGLIGTFLELNVAEACWPEGAQVQQATNEGFTFMKGIYIPENDGRVIKSGDTLNINLLLDKVSEDIMESRNITRLYYDCTISDLSCLENGEPKSVLVKLFQLSDEKKLSFVPSNAGTYRITWTEYQSNYEQEKDGTYVGKSTDVIPSVQISVDVVVVDDAKTVDIDTKEVTMKEGSAKLISFKAESNSKKITGRLSVEKANVKIKVGSKPYKEATVKEKKFILKTAKLKKGTKVRVKVTKAGCKSIVKTYKVN